MISDAYVEVTCDKCHVIEVVQLTAIACQGWDERDVVGHLRRLGWTVNGNSHYCSECPRRTQPEGDVTFGGHRMNLQPKKLPGGIQPKK